MVTPRTRSVELRAGAQAGTFEALVAGYGVDYQLPGGWERLERGAFAGAKQSLPVYAQHRWESAPIGVTTRVREAARGLVVEGRFFLDSDLARRIYEAVKAGALEEWSIAYMAEKVRKERAGGRDVEVVERGRLLEVSSVLAGANPETETLKVASKETIVDPFAARVQRIAQAMRPKTLAELVVSSPAYRAAARGRVPFVVRGPSVKDVVRERATVAYPDVVAEPHGTVRPGGPARFIQRIEVVPVDGGLVPWWRESGTAPTEALGRPVGVALPTATETFTSTDVDLIRFGVAAITHRRVIEYPRILSEFIRRVMLRAFQLGLEKQVLVGSGVRDATEENLVGIVNLPAITSVARGTAQRLDTLAEALRILEDRGYGPALVVAANPTDLKTLRTDTDADGRHLIEAIREVVPGTEFLPAPALTAGTMVVGDVTAAAVLENENDGVSVEISPDHDVVFTAGESALRIDSRVELAADQRGWIKLTGM